MADPTPFAEKLETHGIAVRVEAEAERPIVLEGGTYEIRHLIKKVEGRWSRGEQAWRLPGTEQLERLVGLVESEPKAAPGLAEAKAEFTDWGTKHYHGHRERVRTKFAENGPDSFADYELLELLLFFSIWRRDTKPNAKALIEEFGSLGGVLAADPELYRKHIVTNTEKPEHETDFAFTKVMLKTVKAVLERTLKEEIKDRPVLTSWTALIDYLNMVMVHETAEHFRILFLDRKNILIRDEVQSRGTVDHTPLYPREVVKRALELSASAIIMVHNHPSGDATPSKPDIEMTKAVVTALKAVNITVHDHVIVGKNQHTSFKSHRLI